MVNLYYDNLDDFKTIGKGAFAYVLYDSNNNIALKIYNDDDDLKNDEENAGFKFLEKYNVVIPRDKVYVDGEHVGFSMRFVNGYSLEEYVEHIYATGPIPKIKISSFIKSYYKTIRNIKEISKRNICMADINCGNIIWDNDINELVIVDTALWYEDKEIGESKLCKENISEFKFGIEIKELVKNKAFKI